MKPIAIAAAALVCATSFAQQLNERIEVNVVNVDVTVMSKGAPVRNLTRADFDIFEDGEKQDLTQFTSERVPVSLGIAMYGLIAEDQTIYVYIELDGRRVGDMRLELAEWDRLKQLRETKLWVAPDSVRERDG